VLDLNRISFTSPENQVLAHGTLGREAEAAGRALAHLRHHFILFSSGTSGIAKGYALSQEALLANAQAVNAHLGLTSADVWALSLPVYHVGGLSVLARARLLSNKVVDARGWRPLEWRSLIEAATVTTLVPAQLYDLVRLGVRPPDKLRYAIIGGDFLAPELAHRARALGWPILRTYGMSEVSSQLACSHLGSDELEVLPVHEVRVDEGQRLHVRSPALFTLQFVCQEEVKVTSAKDLCSADGFYPTQDRAQLKGNFLTPLGRIDDQIKVAGHLVDLLGLKARLANLALELGIFGEVELCAESDERKSKRLVLLYRTPAREHLPKLAETLLPASLDECRLVEHFEKTELGKLKAPSHPQGK
jgi:O-succinylbenzoic acid--CoA ligase